MTVPSAERVVSVMRQGPPAGGGLIGAPRITGRVQLTDIAICHPLFHTRLMLTRSLGSSGPVVSALGLGCMGMSGMYGPADRAESIATIHAALGAGITLLDTGDFYGMGHNELLIHEAVKGVPRNAYRLSVKFGALRDPAGNWLGNDTRPAVVKNALAQT